MKIALFKEGIKVAKMGDCDGDTSASKKAFLIKSESKMPITCYNIPQNTKDSQC